jgi:hypothetical protein
MTAPVLTHGRSVRTDEIWRPRAPVAVAAAIAMQRQELRVHLGANATYLLRSSGENTSPFRVHGNVVEANSVAGRQDTLKRM